MIDLHIQYVNYKTKAYLLESLASLEKDLANSSLSSQIAIIDNNSGDDLSDIEAKFPGLGTIDIVHHEHNEGFGSGHNVLAAQADGRLLLLLNPDTKCIEPNTIERLVALQANTQAAVVGPRLVTASGTHQRWDHGAAPTGWWSAIAPIHTSAWKERTKQSEVWWVSGACFLITTEWFNRVGGFDDNFFLYAEEVDLCLRIRQQGGVVLFEPAISMLHYGGVVASKAKYLPASAMYFQSKHGTDGWWQGVLRMVWSWLR